VNEVSAAGEGAYVVLTRDDAKALFGMEGDEAVRGFMEKLRTSPKHREADLVLDCGTAWDPIHRVLTDGTLSYNADEFPNDHCVLGGRRLHEGLDFEVIMVRPDIVILVAESLHKMKRAEFSAKFMALDPAEYGHEPTEAEGDAVWAMFKLIRQLFEDASGEHAAVVFTVKR